MLILLNFGPGEDSWILWIAMKANNQTDYNRVLIQSTSDSFWHIMQVCNCLEKSLRLGKVSERKEWRPAAMWIDSIIVASLQEQRDLVGHRLSWRKIISVIVKADTNLVAHNRSMSWFDKVFKTIFCMVILEQYNMYHHKMKFSSKQYYHALCNFQFVVNLQLFINWVMFFNRKTPLTEN